MTKQRALELVTAHNNEINNYLENQLHKDMGKADNNHFTMSDWFKAQDCIKKQNFYEKGMKILRECRSAGYDVKMNMQSNELVF